MQSSTIYKSVCAILNVQMLAVIVGGGLVWGLEAVTCILPFLYLFGIFVIVSLMVEGEKDCTVAAAPFLHAIDPTPR